MADNETPGAGEQPAASAAAPITVTELPLLERIIAEGKMARDESQRPYARDLIGEFVHQILDEGMTVSKDTVAMIEQRVAKIDELLSAQLNEILQSHLFKKIYEEEYGTFGGYPYGLMVGDFEFGRHPQDMALLEKISNVA